ncbi:uncharacterized protein LOC124889757 [Capsicum annuum]|uniref:uncharacterized protein LOC124889757 n=1 Tax=Capsicum annuum TaxID=4072 RepID=UPI001FB107B1|nr:uncharacterized protein LOC124889757 [Capsicum annuum]
MLKGIPCPHTVAALHHKKMELINYISHWYNRETYMNTYSFFIQPVLNMKMWPQSQNISVMPPPVKMLPGRPGKNRKKEEGETKKKTVKLSKRGIDISCGTCHSKGHNKRRCPTGAPAAGTNANRGPSPSAGADPSTAPTVGKGRGSTGRVRGRPPKNSTEKCADRPRMVGMGLLHTQSGCTIFNPGMPSERFKTAKFSAFVTGNLGYTQKTAVKWKGKKVMTSRQLQEMRGRKQMQNCVIIPLCTSGIMANSFPSVVYIVDNNP